MEKQTLYMVMRLNTNVTICSTELGERVEKISGIAGFVPVYETEREAIEASENGKFKIVAIMV